MNTRRLLRSALFLTLTMLSTGCNCGPVPGGSDAGDAGDSCHCPTGASCQTVEGSVECVCASGYVLDGGSCENVAVVLGGLRWDLPCATAHAGDGCGASAKVMTSHSLGGSPETTYNVTLRFRGVVEYVTVTGGQLDGVFCTGGTPELVGYNTYSMKVSAPSQTYYLNAGHSGPRRCFPVDYTETVPMRGGAVVTLVGDPVDTAQILNIDGDGGTSVVPGVAPYPAAYDGQFLQMDVISVVPR